MSDGLEPFAALLGAEEGRIDLARACLMIAQDRYPTLDVERYLVEIERMALALRAKLPAEAGAEEKVLALNEYLFDELGFRGNTDDYYDPRNSYLNDVIERRTGLPITLAILYMELGRRIGLPLEGISFPGHFLVRLRLRNGVLVLDPFTGGLPLSEAELRERLQRVIPEHATGGLAVSDLPLEHFLEPATPRQILARVLRNLKGIYRDADEPQRLLQVLDRMLVVAPDAHGELRERGLLYRRLECFRAALQDLTAYLEREPQAPDAEETRAALIELSQRCARLN